MIENENGEIAITYYQSVPKKVYVAGQLYIFGVRNRISICWIKKEHVDTVLSMKKKCCGGRTQSGVFRYTTEVELKRHEFGGR